MHLLKGFLPILTGFTFQKWGLDVHTALASLRGLATAPGTESHVAKCKCIMTDDCWPTVQDWDSLNQTVCGRLHATALLAAVCHNPTYNASACAVLRAGWAYPQEHFSSPSSVLAPYFQNQSCDPYTPREKPCTIGNYASYAINVTSADDVAAGLDFAAKHNIRAVIKNTGHDDLGRSTGKGSLGIWTHNLKSISVLQYNSTAYNGSAIRLGAGVEAFEAYAVAHANGLRMVGGECPTVGLAGGYSQGGGYSALSSMYGMGADQTLEWEVVTVDGKHVVASPDENPDLYWALSGGGPGNYGVVLSLTSKAHRDGVVGGASFTIQNEHPTSDGFYQAVEAWHARLADIVDLGVVVSYSMSTKHLVVHGLTAVDKSVTEITDLLRPFLTDLAELKVPYMNLKVTSFPSYYEHFNHYFGPLPYGNWPTAQTTGGRLIPRSIVQNNLTGLTSTIRAIVEDNFIFYAVALSVNHTTNPPPSNAVLPAWRSALLTASVIGKWNFSAPLASNVAVQDRIVSYIEPLLRELAPDSGVYMNEGNFASPHYKEDFYGANYNALREVKRKWDAEGLLYAQTAVGSDAWIVDGEGRLCRAGSEQLDGADGAARARVGL